MTDDIPFIIRDCMQRTISVATRFLGSGLPEEDMQLELSTIAADTINRINGVEG